MSNLDKPAFMNFDVPEAVRPYTEHFDKLPGKYSKYRIEGTKVTYTEGPFGAFFKQEVVDEDWVIGWLNFDIQKPVDLFPITLEPLLALYIGIEGNILCDLQGSEQTLTLPENRLGFYYVPPRGLNCAQFKPFHYTSLYISFSHKFVTAFRDKYKYFQSLLDVPLKQFHDYELAMKAATAKEEGLAGLKEFGDLVDKQENREAAGKQGMLLAPGSEHLDLIKQMKGEDRNPSWLRAYLYGQIWQMMVSYFKQLAERAQLPPKVQETIDYIETNYAEPNKNHQPITPTDVAAHVKMDSRELNKLFRDTLGKTVREYLTDFRFSEACFRLRKTDDKLSSIAEDTGLSGAPHLIKLMKSKHGITPAEYRAR